MSAGEPLLSPSHCDERTITAFSGFNKEELKKVLYIFWPVSASEVLQFLSYAITTAQVGHIGSAELSAITLGRSIYHITGLSLVIGTAVGVRTLGGQAFGAQQYSLLGTVAKRAILINLLLCFLIFLAWTQLTPLMINLGQDPALASLAVRYILGIFPALLADSVIYCLQGYLTCQAMVAPLMIIAGVSVITTPCANYLYLNVYHMGIDGAALALVTVKLMTLLLTLLAVWWVGSFLQEDSKKTWPSWSLDCLKGWDQYLRVSLPSMAMVCASWWIFEAVILIAGKGENAAVQLPVMGILFSLHSLVFMLNAGFSAAASTRVSNLLGEGRGNLAQGSMLLCIMLSSCIDLACCFGLLIWNTPVSEVFSSDPSVVSSTVKAMPWMVLSLLLDGCNEVLGGVLVGSGRQSLGFLTKLLCYWFVGLPLAWLWGSQRGAVGMWQALSAVTVVQTILLGGSVARFDWDAEARRAEIRVLEGVRSMSDLRTALKPKETEHYEP
ncbi:hypothetical protein CEUSTIGMA_g6524.t1 [Chlamydomonas eustigma]|uniref:Protein DETOXIFICATION n=1 Tax=Chlamydomonas eustigma TaxID=1157962 RepID=A0A250X7M1_9CHLO|nr:hypothetical protein CEUSTIGMA_g6524.t1 [Chlamydomonas eustigma]|eukprot:GAX79084.1 hypothetical protein CEUSTIGMA_g6524.t1 [Chlamydomonas eustigma]